MTFFSGRMQDDVLFNVFLSVIFAKIANIFSIVITPQTAVCNRDEVAWLMHTFFWGGIAALTHGHGVSLWSHALHTSLGQAHHMWGAAGSLHITLERCADWGQRNHMPELSMYYVASRKIDQLLKEDTFDMIWILKIYQRANNTHGCLQICTERCVSNLRRDALFRRVKGLSLFDMMQEYFYFVFVVHLYKEKEKIK